MNLVLRQGLRHHRRRPLQTVLTLLGIAAGVALLAAIQLAQRSAERAFDLGLQAVAGDATHSVRDVSYGVPVAAYAALRARLGGGAVTPSVVAVARVPRGDGERTVLRVVGIDPFADVGLRVWQDERAAQPVPTAALLTVPGAFVATDAVRQRLGVRTGERVVVTVGGRPHTATCVGSITPRPLVAAGLADVLVVDIATAQEWTGRLDRVDRLELRLAPDALPAGMDAAAALAAVHDVLGPAAQVVAVGSGHGGLQQLARGFRVNLAALSLLSLLVGAFLVHETMRLSVVARRRSFGVLRALGVTATRLGTAVAGESLLLGLVGSSIGAALGAWFARVLLAPLVRSLNDHYATFDLREVDVDPALMVAAVALGSAVALLAGLGPAIAAARVPPREVLVAARPQPGRGPRHLLRVAVVAGAAGAVLLATVDDRLGQAYAGLGCVLLAAVALVPGGMAVLLAATAASVRRAGPLVRYVVRGTAAARAHLALPVAAMVLALATTVALATLVGSFRDSVASWLTQVLPADVYVSVPSGVDERTTATLDAAAVAALAAQPDTAVVTRFRRTKLALRGGRGEGEIECCGFAGGDAVVHAFTFVAGDAETARERFVAGAGAWVSEPLAFRWGLTVGDALTVTTANGPVSLPVLAVHRDYSNERGEVLVAESWLLRHRAAGITSLALTARPGTEVDAWVTRLRAAAAAASDQDLAVRAQRELREGSLAIFDRTFAITGVMRVLCLLVAFCGIYAAFAALQLERGAEVGLLRCLGAVPRQIGGVVLGQTALLGAVAGVLALPVGIGFGHLLAHVVNRVSFGWSLAVVSVPWPALGDVLLLAVGASLLAGVQPALRFARLRPADALREV
jgi:putative ABC transport system permease protein